MYKPYTGASTNESFVPNAVLADHCVINHCNYLETENFRLQAEIDRLKAENEAVVMGIKSRDKHIEVLKKEKRLQVSAISKAIDLIDDGNYSGSRFVLSLVEHIQVKPEEDGE